MFRVIVKLGWWVADFCLVTYEFWLWLLWLGFGFTGLLCAFLGFGGYVFWGEVSDGS